MYELMMMLVYVTLNEAIASRRSDMPLNSDSVIRHCLVTVTVTVTVMTEGLKLLVNDRRLAGLKYWQIDLCDYGRDHDRDCTYSSRQILVDCLSECTVFVTVTVTVLFYAKVSRNADFRMVRGSHCSPIEVHRS